MAGKMQSLLNGTLAVLKIGHYLKGGQLKSKKIDYKTLSQYILNINTIHNIDGILLEASSCLKSILDYDLFGFVLKSSASLDLWIDPRVYKEHFVQAVEREFALDSNKYTIHYFDPALSSQFGYSGAIDPQRLISIPVMDDECVARLYLLPQREMIAYHTDIIGIIGRTIEVAIRNSMRIKDLETAASVDPLTGCFNRRALGELMAHDLEMARRYGLNMSVIMFDIDHFKNVNDTYGHDAGDMVLRELAKKVRGTLRKSDYVARYGGEEFVIVLPETSFVNALELANRLRAGIEEMELVTDNTTVRVTSSFGVATLKADMNDETLLKEADTLLYEAKRLGRNRVMPNVMPVIASLAA